MRKIYSRSVGVESTFSTLSRVTQKYFFQFFTGIRHLMGPVCWKVLVATISLGFESQLLNLIACFALPGLYLNFFLIWENSQNFYFGCRSWNLENERPNFPKFGFRFGFFSILKINFKNNRQDFCWKVLKKASFFYRRAIHKFFFKFCCLRRWTDSSKLQKMQLLFVSWPF